MRAIKTGFYPQMTQINADFFYPQITQINTDFF